MIYIAGVVGSGKTFLLTVVIMFLHELLHATLHQDENERDKKEESGREKRKWKVMVVSNTDVQVSVRQLTLA